MTRAWVVALALVCAPLVVAAQSALPALYDVTGVAADDALNIRAEPAANAEIIGTLPSDARSVEVVAVDASGKWALVNSAERSGYVALRFLLQQDSAVWGALKQPMHCFGTEPFWSLRLAPATGVANLSDPETPSRPVMVSAVWPNTPYHATAAFAFEGAGFGGFASLRGASCSDGMSENQYGIGISLFLRDAEGAASTAMQGCCTLVP